LSSVTAGWATAVNVALASRAAAAKLSARREMEVVFDVMLESSEVIAKMQ
jgi:hypothetical protein